jgi:ankyrin repeat protein
MAIWDAAKAGDLAEVERLVGQDRGLLDATDGLVGWTPLILASMEGHVGVVQWLLHQGMAVDGGICDKRTALWFACREGPTPVVRLLLERGTDPTIASLWDQTPLTVASSQGHLEVVRLLLGHPSARTTLNQRDDDGETALWYACYCGRGVVVRALLASGADPTIADKNGNTPMAVAKQLLGFSHEVTAEDRRKCVAALEVSFWSSSPLTLPKPLLPSSAG